MVAGGSMIAGANRMRDGWPTVIYGVDPGDGRTVAAYNKWLSEHGHSFPRLIESLGGPSRRYRAQEWSVDVIRVAAHKYIVTHGKTPTARSVDRAGLPGSWNAALQWLAGVGVRRSAIFGRRHFTKDEFVAYAARMSIGTYDAYAALYVEKKLDRRCPRNPVAVYGDKWSTLMRGRGGVRYGDGHAATRVTSKQVSEIRTRHAHGESQRVLADNFGVTRQCIWQIVHRVSHCESA